MKKIPVIHKMTKMGCFIIGLILVLVLVLHNWILEAYVPEGTTVNTPFHHGYIYMTMEPDVEYTQSIWNVGASLNNVKIKLKNCGENAGTLKCTIYDKKGNKILTRKKKLQGNSKGICEIKISAKGKLSFGKKYTLKVTYSPSTDVKESGEFATLRVYKPLVLKAHMFADEKRTSYGIVMETDYKKYIDVGSVLFSGLFILGIICLSFVRKKIHLPFWLFAELMAVFTTVFGYLSTEWINGAIGYASWKGLLVNGLPIYIGFMLVLFVCNSVAVTYDVTAGAFLVFAMINHYVSTFRDRPFMPWDIYSAGTVFSMRDGLKLEGDGAIAVCVLAYLFMVLLISRTTTKNRQLETGEEGLSKSKIFFRRKLWRQVICRFIAISQAGVCIYVFVSYMLPGVVWGNWNIASYYKKGGTIASFIKYASIVSYDAPEGYNAKECERILEEEPVVPALSKTKAKNIIVVMNESFADMRMVGSGELPGDYMPGFDSLSGNVIKGKLHVPTIDGGTANTEFEVLTGCSCAFVPGMPYQMYIYYDMSSLARELQEKQYDTVAFHPSLESNYNRNSVYPKLGFENCYWEKDMEKPALVRDRIADTADYEYVKKNNATSEGDGYFMFNVTIQNHSGYRQKNFENEDLSSIGKYPSAEQYLALVKESDRAFMDLIDYYDSIDEPTLICFFGDHQARIEDEFYEYLYGKPLSALTKEETAQKYVTPYIIWTNYEIEEEEIPDMSSNYLSAMLLRAAGYELTGFNAFLYHLYEEYPVLSPYGIYDKDGTFYSSVEELQDEQLMKYEQLQYYRMKGH